MKRLSFLAAYVIPSLILVGYVLGGWWHFLTPAVVFGLVPLLDLICGRDTHNPADGEITALRDDRYYRWITWLYVPTQWALVIWAASVVAAGGLATHELIGFLVSVGMVTGGIGITVAHELGHRSGKLEQNLAKTLLMSVSYTHFFIEHNQGHHARVATPDDPASARYGESLYRFYPRTVFYSFIHAWRIEAKRLEKRGFAVMNPKNQMIWFSILPFVCAGLLSVWMGPMAGAFFLIQSVIAFSLLEMVNYVEHYGLSREKREDGKYEKVKPIHSWNASETITNSLLFNLQRHSDHHANANRRYQTLRHFDDVPQLPTGYAGMILLALVPPLWRKVMDPKVETVNAL